MKKRGLVLIYKPANLLQFFWYYCTYGKDTEWDVLCLVNGLAGSKMPTFCEKCGLFNSIISATADIDELSLFEKTEKFIHMFLCFVFAKQYEFCKKTVQGYVNIDEYSDIVLPADIGFVAGAFIGISKNYNVSILQDGTLEYGKLEYRNFFKKKLNTSLNLIAFFSSIMGYATIEFVYPLKTTKNCIKYCSKPEKMQYRNYKEIRKLFDFSNTNMDLYNSIISKVYSKINDYDFSKVDTILFTAPFEEDFINDFSPFMEKLKKYVKSNSRSLYIKKHPRDAFNYDFGEGIEVKEIDQSIPAEVIIPHIKNKRLVFETPSSIMLTIPNNYDINIIYFKDMRNISIKENLTMNYYDKTQFKDMTDLFKLENPTIVEL